MNPFTWFTSRISVKLALVMVLVVVVPLAGLGIMLTLAAENAVKESVRRDHEEIARRAAHELSLFVERPIELLRSSASMIAISQADRWQQETVLVELSIHFPFFEEVTSVSSEGEILASSNPGKPPEFRNKKAAMKAVNQKENFISEVYLSKDYLPYIDAGVPYFFRGKVAGALLARIDLRGMWEITDEIRVGETGRAFLVSQKGILIAHPDKKKVLQNVDVTREPSVARVLEKKTGTLEIEKEQEGEWLVSYAPVRGELGWGIVIEQKTEEAYALLRTMLWATAGAGALAVLAAILASILTARRVVKPVRALDFWSRRIALGDFDYGSKYRSRDELGRLFIAFRRMRDELRAAREQEYLAMLGTASSALAHKIKNSVVSLKTFSDLFPARRGDPEFIRRFEAEFPQSVSHLEHILRQLSKVASDYSLQIAPIDLSGLLQKLAMKFQGTCEKQHVTLRIEGDGSIPKVEGDSERLGDVFENLFVNALEAMPGGGELSFHVRNGRGRIAHPRFIPLEEDVELVEITVKDTGLGILREKLDQVFQPFVTSKRGGMGIGLTVVKKVVQEHGGTVQVESEPGRGTTFRIMLPVNASRYGVFK